MTDRIKLLRDEKAEIKNRAAKTLHWSPHEFIRGISIEGDRELFLSELFGEIPQENDFRFLCGDARGNEILVMAERLPWDSSFFGIETVKIQTILHLGSGKIPHDFDLAPFLGSLLVLMGEKRIEYIFFQVDSRETAVIRALGATGFSLIESRAYYHRDLTNYVHDERYPVRLANEEDIESLATAAATMINPYDRFHADPAIGFEKADALMRKWIYASIKEGFADGVLVPDVRNPSAFCTVKYHKEKWKPWGLHLSQPILSAVSKELKGWYKKIISEMNYHLLDIGAQHSFLVTQVTNFAVIRVWETLGYRFGKCEHVFRWVPNLPKEKKRRCVWM